MKQFKDQGSQEWLRELLLESLKIIRDSHAAARGVRGDESVKS